MDAGRREEQQEMQLTKRGHAGDEDGGRMDGIHDKESDIMSVLGPIGEAEAVGRMREPDRNEGWCTYIQDVALS